MAGLEAEVKHLPGLGHRFPFRTLILNALGAMSVHGHERSMDGRFTGECVAAFLTVSVNRLVSQNCRALPAHPVGPNLARQGLDLRIGHDATQHDQGARRLALDAEG